MDRKTYVLGVATALLLLAAGAWPHAEPTARNLDHQPGYFWRIAGEDRITLAEATQQAARVTTERKLPRSRIDGLIARSTHNDTYNLTGRPKVDVAELNARLDGHL